MKKPSSLAEQVREAQRIYDSWPVERQLSVRLEGSSSLRDRYPSSPSQLPAKTSFKKKSTA